MLLFIDTRLLDGKQMNLQSKKLAVIAASIVMMATGGWIGASALLNPPDDSTDRISQETPPEKSSDRRRQCRGSFGSVCRIVESTFSNTASRPCGSDGHCHRTG